MDMKLLPITGPENWPGIEIAQYKSLNRTLQNNPTLTSWARFYWHDLTLMIAWINNYAHCNVWDEFTYPFLNFNGATRMDK